MSKYSYFIKTTIPPIKGYKYTAIAEDNYHLPCDDNVDLYIHSPTRLHGVVLN
jgi:hypothetical protein